MKAMITTALVAMLATGAMGQKHWTSDAHQYANTMTVVGVVVINEAEIPRESMEVGAFCNGECRGSETLRYKANVDRYLAYLSVSGADGDAITFRLYDAETETELLATAAAQATRTCWTSRRRLTRCPWWLRSLRRKALAALWSARGSTCTARSAP